MDQVIRFAVLGLGTGAVYALVGQGVVLVYRGSGIVNFAHGGLAMVGAFTHWELHFQRGWPLVPSMCVAVAFAALLGALVHVLVMRPLAGSAPLVRVIATLALLTILTASAELHWGGDQRVVPTSLPVERWSVGSITFLSDRVYLLGIATGTTAVLWAIYRYTRFGLAVTAAAEDELSASALGWSPDVLATVNWGAGGALAALAGILVMPLTGLQVDSLALIVIAALAAALLGGFSSFWLTLVGGVAIGIAQSLAVRYANQPGAADAVPFLIISLVLVVRGRALPLRSHVLERLPRLGPDRVPGALLAVPVVLAALAVWVFPGSWNNALIVSTVMAIIVLSVVVVTGFAGQISLAQVALAGLGALVAGRLVASRGVPFELAIVAGTLASLVIGLLFALPALRTRGLNLAVVTLGMGLAVQVAVFGNTDYTGGATGTPVGKVTFFGIGVDRLEHPDRYAMFCLAWLTLAIVLVRNVRRGRAGRRLVAVRTNERAAASLGIGVFGAKLYAYAVSAVLAGIGGTLLAFQDRVVVYERFSPFESINVVLLAVLGGVGYMLGPVAGSLVAVGGIASIVTNEIGVDQTWILLAGGVVVLFQLVTAPDGMVSLPSERLRARRGDGGDEQRSAVPEDVAGPEVAVPRVPDVVLAVRHLSVRIGGIQPVRCLSLTVRTGEIVGLIGPNGAGKTTFIDAVTGFTRPFEGEVSLGSSDITRWSAARRTRAGISRTFQSLELFDDLTVRENLLAGADRFGVAPYLTDAFRSRSERLSPAARRVVGDLDLGDVLERPITTLPYGQRRLVSLARALASTPSMLLLDEPAAGLSDAETMELRDMLRRLADEWGLGILLVEHDMRLVMSVCDRIVAIDSGMPIAEGTPDQIGRNEHVRASYLGAEESLTSSARAATSVTSPGSLIGPGPPLLNGTQESVP